MKKYLLLWLLVANTTVFAQFKLSGKILHHTGDANLLIDIPVVYGIFEQNFVKVPVAKNGAFKVSLPIKGQRFANLMFQANSYTLLLNSNKNLLIELDANSKGLKVISGTAQPENALLQRINLEEAPSFLVDDVAGSMDATALNNQLLKPYYVARDRKIAQVNQSSISLADKKLITAEIKYIAYNNLHELADLGGDNLPTLKKFLADIYKNAAIKPEAMPAGPQYYRFVNNYLQEIEKRTTGTKKLPIERWQSAVKYLPATVVEQYGYQLIISAYYNNNKVQGKLLSAAYLTKFPSGVYAADVKAKAAKMN